MKCEFYDFADWTAVPNLPTRGQLDHIIATQQQQHHNSEFPGIPSGGFQQALLDCCICEKAVYQRLKQHACQ